MNYFTDQSSPRSFLHPTILWHQWSLL